LESRIAELQASLADGVDPNVADSQGFTPLHFAAQSLRPEATKLLIDAGADLEARNKFGATPLLVAMGNARDDDHGVVGIPLEAGADPDAQNNAGVSPRSLADLVANYDLKRYLRIGG
jgi:ankyrin repeat protein